MSKTVGLVTKKIRHLELREGEIYIRDIPLSEQEKVRWRSKRFGETFLDRTTPSCPLFVSEEELQEKGWVIIDEWIDRPKPSLTLSAG